MLYRQVRPQLQTGDIVLFSGRDPYSFLIRVATRSPYSHVGLVLHLPELNSVFLWESTTLIKTPIFSGRQEGVHLILLSERLQTYNGRCVVRHLQAERTPEMLRQLQIGRAHV